MIEYLLVDLDDTLLQNSMEVFAPPYYKALSAHISSFVAPEVMLPKLMEGTQAMLMNDNALITLEKSFDNIFYPGIGVSKAEIHPHLEDFYDHVFPKLQKYTLMIPTAAKMIKDALALDIKVVVATNPLFPMKAIHHRLEWAGLDPKEIPFTLITSYERFHFTKPNSAYYQEILDEIGATSDQCVMVGNDVEMDILPALKIGIKCFRINGNDPWTPSDPNIGAGSQSDVIPWILKLN